MPRGNYRKIGQALRNEDNICRSQTKNPLPDHIYLEALDTKFFDQDIDIILEKLFGCSNKNNRDRKASLGWLTEEKVLSSAESKKKK
jgi:hypothetical protein